MQHLSCTCRKLISRPLKVEAGQEFSVGETGSIELLCALAELDSHIGHFRLKGGDPLVELVDVLWSAEPGVPPGLLAHQLREATLKLLHAGGEAGTAGLGGVQVGLQRCAGHLSFSARARRLGGEGVHLVEQVTVTVGKGPVDPGSPACKDGGGAPGSGQARGWLRGPGSKRTRRSRGMARATAR